MGKSNNISTFKFEFELPIFFLESTATTLLGSARRRRGATLGGEGDTSAMSDASHDQEADIDELVEKAKVRRVKLCGSHFRGAQISRGAKISEAPLVPSDPAWSGVLP